MAALPGTPGLAALACAVAALAALQRTSRAQSIRLVCLLLAGLLAGSLDTCLQGRLRLADALADAYHDQIVRLQVRVLTMPQDDDGGRRFMAEVGKSRPPGIPRIIRVTWHARPGAAAALPEVIPGSDWRMALVLRRPYGPSNPYAADMELRSFAAGIRAEGTVRGNPQKIADEPWATAAVGIETLRYRIRAGMRAALEGMRYGPVLIALTIGDQAGIAREDWQVFNRSGISHLVAISGAHITLVAAMGGLLASFLWRRWRWRGVGLAEYLPAQLAACSAALCVALGYCLLAGWGVPARRTFFMLACLAAAGLARLPLSASRLLLLAGACVLALDPWAMLSAGFWLSFGAVAILMRLAVSHAEPALTWRERARRVLAGFCRTQGAITLGLAPLLAFLVHQVSLGSPLANAVAVPIVGALVTPLALLCGVLSVMPGGRSLAWAAGWLGHGLFAAVMQPVGWIGRSEWAAAYVAAAAWPWLLPAFLGVAIALQGRGGRWRFMGWLGMLPLLLWRPDRPQPGDWRMIALDVGQGSALIIETATRTLLYDAGPRYYGGGDAGERVLAPYLHARGARRIDTLVVSHADQDHAGGLRSILQAFPVDVSYASFDLAAHLRRQAARSSEPELDAVRLPGSRRECEAGMAWESDGVLLRFVHPQKQAAAHPQDKIGRIDTNARSCVLVVQGRHHTILLPGDAGVAQETRYAAVLPPIDVVAAPHHGSSTSSGTALVRAVGPAQVIVQAGYLNRFRHPSGQVVSRWQAWGASVWRTDLQGAVTIESSGQGLLVNAQRETARRYWHAVLPWNRGSDTAASAN
ncbi:DNA internalization-related competence protein ComEC/Rec2 [Bordetella sp. FB-8]|uniref:DNA internalization-related competence protein ComEC/Rec2 n=1 Tax=Bordetella sp. FB-8 TaxID=1159870 RepID=UPI0018CA009A